MDLFKTREKKQLGFSLRFNEKTGSHSTQIKPCSNGLQKIWLFQWTEPIKNLSKNKNKNQ